MCPVDWWTKPKRYISIWVSMDIQYRSGNNLDILGSNTIIRMRTTARDTFTSEHKFNNHIRITSNQCHKRYIFNENKHMDQFFGLYYIQSMLVHSFHMSLFIYTCTSTMFPRCQIACTNLMLFNIDQNQNHQRMILAIFVSLLVSIYRLLGM